MVHHERESFQGRGEPPDIDQESMRLLLRLDVIAAYGEVCHATMEEERDVPKIGRVVVWKRADGLDGF